MYYKRRDKIYQVTEMWPTFTKLGICYGDSTLKRTETHIVIRPRLMEKLNGNDLADRHDQRRGPTS